MEKNYKSVAFNFGLYLGVILSLITVLAYALNPDLFTKWWLGITIFLLIIVFGIIAVINAKKTIIGGFMSFKEAFTSFFIAVAVGTLISTIVSIILFNFVDTETAEYINEQTVEMSREMMENFGAPASDVDKAIAELEKENQFSIVSNIEKYVYGLAFYAVIGLIIGLIFRKKDPNAV